jgi:hypothetical protein
MLYEFFVIAAMLRSRAPTSLAARSPCRIILTVVRPSGESPPESSPSSSNRAVTDAHSIIMLPIEWALPFALVHRQHQCRTISSTRAPDVRRSSARSMHAHLDGSRCRDHSRRQRHLHLFAARDRRRQHLAIDNRL